MAAVYYMIFLFLSVFSYISNSTITLPDVLWDPRNPLFDSDKCLKSSRTFYTKLGDKVSILCGNLDLNNGFDEVKKSKDMFNYNIFVTDNYETYIQRDGTNAYRLYNCIQKIANDENVFRSYIFKYVEILTSMQRISGGITYEEGSTYYFFTTSDGSKDSLNNKVGKNDSMGFKIFICHGNVPCEDRSRVNVCKVRQQNVILEDSSKMMQRASKEDESVSKNMQTPILALAFCLTALIGIAIGVVVMHARNKTCNKGDKDGKGGYTKQISSVSSSGSNSNDVTATMKQTEAQLFV